MDVGGGGVSVGDGVGLGDGGVVVVGGTVVVGGGVVTVGLGLALVGVGDGVVGVGEGLGVPLGDGLGDGDGQAPSAHRIAVSSLTQFTARVCCAVLVAVFATSVWRLASMSWAFWICVDCDAPAPLPPNNEIAPTVTARATMRAATALRLLVLFGVRRCERISCTSSPSVVPREV